MKRIVTMQDISCVGKCSLTTALPVISAMGVEAAVMPTAVLSTHTAFSSFTFHDLTGEIQKIMDVWKKENITFDAVYTGYLGSFEQLELAHKLLADFGEGKLKIIDPCMADNGSLYPGFTKEYASAMAKLCKEADIICPNLTEASYLLDIPYTKDYDEVYVRKVLKSLTDLGCDSAVLTGISLADGKLGAYAYTKSTNTYFSYFNEEEREHFHGTGDIWASTLCGALVIGKSFPEAVAIACDYVKECIRLTLLEENHNTYGVNFEQAIPYLLSRVR